MKIAISTALHCSAQGTVDLPVNSWDEIEEWYVKWDTLHFKVVGDSTLYELELHSDDTEIDWKRPTLVEIHSTDSDGYSNFDCIDEHA